MKKFGLLIALIVGWSISAVVSAELMSSAAKESSVGIFDTAQKFELRGESYSAQLEYQNIFEQLLESIKENKDPELNAALAEFALEKSLELSVFTCENSELAELVTNALKDKITQPFLERHLLTAAVALNMRLGDAQKVRQFAARMGCVRDFYFAANDLSKMKFRKITSAAGVAKPAVFFSAAKPDNLTAAFVVENKSSGSVKAQVKVESTVPFELYINEYKVTLDNIKRDVLSEVKVLSLNLPTGKSVIRLHFLQELDKNARFRVCFNPVEGSGSEKVGISENNAEALALLKSVIDKPSGSGEQGVNKYVISIVDPGASRIFASAIKNKADNFDYAYYLGYILSRRQLLGRGSNAPTQLLMQAAKSSKNSGIYFLTLAKLSDQSKRARADRDENMRRLALLKVIALNPDSVSALTELAKYYLYSVGSLEKAKDYIDQALKNNPQSVEANLALIDLYRKRGWGARAYSLLLELAKRNPQVALVRLYEGQLAEQFSQAAKSLASFKAAYSADMTNIVAFGKYAGRLYAAGDFQKWQDLLNSYLLLYPYETSYLGELMHYSLYRLKFEEAAKVLKRLGEINAESALYLKLAGELAEAQGKQEQAIAYYQRSQNIDPSDISLRDYLASMGKGQSSPMTEIASISDYAQQFNNFKPAPGTERVYLLDEVVDQLHEDTTKSRSRYSVIKVLGAQGAQKTRRVPIWYDREYEQVKVLLSKVVHSDGSSSTAQVVPINRRGDKRVVLVVFPALVKGDIVELKYTISQKKPDFFGKYFGNIHIFKRFNPVLRARYVLISPKNMKLYFHTLNGAPKAMIKEEDGDIVRSWQMNDLQALDYEAFMPRLSELSPVVQVSTFKDWDALSRWYWNLIKDQNISNSEIKQKVQELTVGLNDPKKKLEAIYKWVVTNVRNNAWEFGVHGYKPYNASAIFTRRFGDCKDKATLINVMAREAGIDAWPLLLRSVDPADVASGRTSEDLTLPLLSHFNHCISVADIGGKMYYLDGTMQYQTLDSLPFTDTGAEAVIVRPKGAQRISLPKHTPQTNLWQGLTQIKINEKENADFEFTFSGTGQISVFLRSWFRNPQSWDNVLRAIATQKLGRVSAVVVDDVVLEGLDNAGASFQGRVRVKKYAKIEKDQLRFKIPGPLLEGNFGGDGALPKSLMAFAANSLRSSDLVLPSLFDISRQVRVEWAEGWELSEKFENIEYESDFAELKVEYVVANNMLEINYHMKLKKMVVSVAEYSAFRRFCQMVDRINTHSYILHQQ